MRAFLGALPIFLAVVHGRALGVDFWDAGQATSTVNPSLFSNNLETELGTTQTPVCLEQRTSMSWTGTQKDNQGRRWALSLNADQHYSLVLHDSSHNWVGTERGSWCISYDGT